MRTCIHQYAEHLCVIPMFAQALPLPNGHGSLGFGTQDKETGEG